MVTMKDASASLCRGYARRVTLRSADPADGCLDLVGRGRGMLVLPDAKNGPPVSLESSVNVPVTYDIRIELGRPIFRVAAGARPVVGTGMPEAAVDEHREPAPRERDVDMRAHRRCAYEEVLAEAVPPPVQLRSDQQLGLRVRPTVRSTDPAGGARRWLRVGHSLPTAEHDVTLDHARFCRNPWPTCPQQKGSDRPNVPARGPGPALDLCPSRSCRGA